MTQPDPDELAALLAPVASADQIDALPRDTVGVIASGLDDALLAMLALRVPELRYLMTDGNARVTDIGLVALNNLPELDSLDLEYAPVTDAALELIARHHKLRWVDLGGCTGVTAAAVSELRMRRPALEVDWW